MSKSAIPRALLSRASAKAPTTTRCFASSSNAPVPGVSVGSDTAGSASKTRVLPGESPEESWKRNMREVREWRRQRDVQRSKLPLFLPPSRTPPPRAASPTKLSLSTLLASGAALGHASHTANPAFLPYVYGTRSGLSIIDLDQSLPLLRRAASLVRDVVRADGVVVVVGTRQGHARALQQARKRMGDNAFMVNEWLPGTLTNSTTFFGIGPTENRSHLPDLAIFLNPSENLGAIRECTAKNIPTVGVVDTDTDPRIVTYPIPANMESLRTSELILGALSIAGAEGKRIRLNKEAVEAQAREDRLRSIRKATQAEQAEQDTLKEEEQY